MTDPTINLDEFTPGSTVRLTVETSINGTDEFTGEVTEQFEDSIIVDLTDEMILEGTKAVDTIAITYLEDVNEEYPLVKNGITVYRTAVTDAEIIA